MNDKCLNLFQDELFQFGFIFHRAIRGKEAVLDALHGVIADKFVTKRHFVDFSPSNQSGHSGLRGELFPIGIPSFRLRYSYSSGQFDHLNSRNRLMNFRYLSCTRNHLYLVTALRLSKCSF